MIWKSISAFIENKEKIVQMWHVTIFFVMVFTYIMFIDDKVILKMETE